MAGAEIVLKRQTVDMPGNDSPTAHSTGSELQELLTVEEVAALLKVSKSWVYEHTRCRGGPRSERLPHVKVGKYVRFDARLVRDFLVKRSRIG
jgi:excisionase family DNA binding protein